VDSTSPDDPPSEEKRPIPDLGFFAGAPRTGSAGGSFGGSPPPSSQFGGPPPSSQFGGSPQGSSQFGGPPQPTSQFGAPPQAGSQFGAPPQPGSQFGAPPMAPQWGMAPPGAPGLGQALPPAPGRAGGISPNARRLLLRVGGSLLVLIVLGAFGVGRFRFVSSFFAHDLHEPPTLAGQPRLTGPVAEQMEAAARSQLTPASSQEKSAIAVYTAQQGRMYLLIAQPGHARVDKEFADMGATDEHVQGNSHCGTSPQRLVLCMRTSRSLTVTVGGNASDAEISAAVDEAWDAV
jgi:hypothetical protein